MFIADGLTFFILQEDDEVIRKRAAVKGLYDSVKMAIDDVQYMAEKIRRTEEDKESVPLNAEVLALADMTEHLSSEQKKRYADIIHTPYLPELRPPVPLSHMSR
jgi:hypothetical protein